VPAPSELAHQETRRLGVALSWLELAPAELHADLPEAVIAQPPV
jgi:hypothetical protein